MKETKYTGAGLNGPSMFKAVNRSIYSPSKDTVPAGGSWPFVTLTFKDGGVEFKLMHIRRFVKPSDATVGVTKYGYFFFHTADENNDFGFTTLKMRSFANELQTHGFRFDDSYSRNMTIARVSLYLLTVPAIFLAIIIVMTILKPHGV